jgi:replicative DNA helicase
VSKRIPPHDQGAEASLIGAALLRQQIVDTLKGHVDPSDFYNPRYGHVWAAMLELHEHGEPIDIVTVASKVAPFDIDVPFLAEAQNSTPAVSAAPRYADLVVEASRRRKLLAHLSGLAERCYEDPADAILADIDPGGDHLIARRDAEVRGLYGITEFVEKTQRVEDQGEWLVPHIFRPRWRVVVVAGEGIGKGTLMRSLGLHAAAGRDPFNPGHLIPNRRVLYVDAENPDTTILHQIRVSNQDVDLAAEAHGHYWVWHREGGINLRDRRARAEFESVLQQTRPEIVFAGPFYKLFRRKASEDLEQSTIEFLEVLDDFRVRFNFALMLEAHAPKGTGGYREMNPRGSAALMGWPEFGITMEPVGNPLPTEESITLDIGRFRRDREHADWPTQMFRGKLGQRVAFAGYWPNGRNRQGYPY